MHDSIKFVQHAFTLLIVMFIPAQSYVLTRQRAVNLLFTEDVLIWHSDCLWRTIHIIDMTLESKVNVTILKSLLRLPSPTPLSFYRPRVFMFGILISYGVQITTKVSKYGNGFGS